MVVALPYKPKNAATFPDGLSEIFHRLDSSGRMTELGSTPPGTEMRTRDFPWGLRAVGA